MFYFSPESHLLRLVEMFSYSMHINVGDPISSRDYLKFYSTLANIVVDLNGTKIERLRNNL